MILTVTLNPAIDRTILADRLVFEDRAYIQSSSESPGGRGLNASAVLHSFGAPTLAIIPSGGESGRRLEEKMLCCQFPCEVVRIRHHIRTNLIITDKQGLTIKLNEPGPELSEDELAETESAIERHLPGADWIMLCGSLPPGVPQDYYRLLIRKAKAHGVKTLLDTDAEPLQHGLEEGPSVVCPNQQEAERLLNRVLLTRQHFLDAAARIHAMGAGAVVLSLGSRGAVGACEGRTWEVTPPRVEAVSPIGAGDALNAAYVWSITQGDGFPEALRWGVAAGTASAALPGMSFAGLEQTRAIQRRVEVREGLKPLV